MRQSRAAQLRRRRLTVTTSVVGGVALIVVLATQLGSIPHSHAHTGSKPTTHSSTPAANVNPATAANEMTALRKAITSYVSHRHGSISAAAYDRNNGQLMVFHPKVRGRTASIVKADILEARLHQTNGHLTDSDRDTATSMIENSDNDSATDLFDEDGGPSGLTAYNKLLGLKGTTPNHDWGDTMTSAADQVTLVRELLSPSKVLTNSARAFQRDLMTHVESDQRWGISGGVPKGVAFGNKNGWLPDDEDNNLWIVNSIGWVHGDGKSYVIAVITHHNATEGYGIKTIDQIAARAWKHMSVKKTS